jgi:hypothetical protein
VAIDRDPSPPVGDDCASALEIDTFVAASVYEGSTVLNSNQLEAPPCVHEGKSPDQFYRLDLRGRESLTRLRTTLLADGLTFSPALVLLGGSETQCGEVLYCTDSISIAEGPPSYDLNLEPALYYLAVDGADLGEAGDYRLVVELDDAEAQPCLSARMDECAYSNDATWDCCGAGFGSAGFSSPSRCLRTAILCGLAPPTRDCVCDVNAACCGAAGGDTCSSDVLDQCGFFCPEYAPGRGECLR